MYFLSGWIGGDAGKGEKKDFVLPFPGIEHDVSSEPVVESDKEMKEIIKKNKCNWSSVYRRYVQALTGSQLNIVSSVPVIAGTWVTNTVQLVSSQERVKMAGCLRTW